MMDIAIMIHVLYTRQRQSVTRRYKVRILHNDNCVQVWIPLNTPVFVTVPKGKSFDVCIVFGKDIFTTLELILWCHEVRKDVTDTIVWIQKSDIQAARIRRVV